MRTGIIIVNILFIIITVFFVLLGTHGHLSIYLIIPVVLYSFPTIMLMIYTFIERNSKGKDILLILLRFIFPIYTVFILYFLFISMPPNIIGFVVLAYFAFINYAIYYIYKVQTEILSFLE